MSKPKLAIITSVIDNRDARGTALVARQLLSYLSEIKNDFEITLIHHTKSDNAIYKEYREFIIPKLKLPIASTLISEAVFWLRLRLQNKRFDIAHYMQPRVWPSYLFTPAKKIIITMHEAGIMLNLHHIGKGERMFRFTNRYLSFRMHKVIAVSEYGKKEIAQYCGINPDRIEVIYNGLDAGFSTAQVTPELIQELKSKYNILHPYILSVGRLDPHKNILKLLDAYADFRKAGNKENLILVGGKHMPDYSELVEKKIKELHLENSVIITPFITDADLPKVYSAARALVYPSLHEGFGLPIIHAFACNLPVACSNVTSLPEIAGNAALLFDPNDTGAITKALNQITSDENLRANLILKGKARLTEFSWNTSAKKLFALYRSLISAQ